MTDDLPYYPEIEDATRLERRKDWERNRAAGIRLKEEASNVTTHDFSPIVFPDCPGLCHAARVVAGRMAEKEPDLLDAIEATRDLLLTLGIIQVMEHGGDGRVVKMQRGPVRLPGDDELPPEPIGYKEDDVGRPVPKMPRVRPARSGGKPDVAARVRNSRPVR